MSDPPLPRDPRRRPRRPPFGPGGTQVFRVVLGLGVLFVAGAFAADFSYYHSSWWTRQTFADTQPVLFSHRHHARELKIDCRFCHSSVETSAFAGMPPTETCLTCHSQIFTDTAMLRPVVLSAERGLPLRWQAVTRTPDFVYFNHSIHIAKGVGCTTCHGDIGNMALTAKAERLDMRWCLSCHRDPAKALRPKSEIFDPDWRPPPDQERLGRALMALYHVNTQVLTDCNTCHR